MRDWSTMVACCTHKQVDERKKLPLSMIQFIGVQGYARLVADFPYTLYLFFPSTFSLQFLRKKRVD
jgi:hypothetical protein